MIYVAVAASVLLVAGLSIPLWKPLVYRFKWGVVAANAYQDLLRRTGFVSGQIGNPYTSARDDSDIPPALNAINHTFENYAQYAHLSPESLNGARVLEIGPGNNVGVALRFVAEGASRVVALDRFAGFQDTPFHRRLYAALRDQLAADKRRRVDEAIRLDGAFGLNESRLLHVQKAIEEIDALFPARSFDLIVSNAVLEEIYDTDAAFRAMDRLLAPGGQMMHAIDLRDYGMFTKHGFHPLEFLTVPDSIYRYMSESVGQPNRRLVDYYRTTMALLGYSSTIHITWIVGAPQRMAASRTTLRKGVDYSEETLTLIRQIRPGLLERYRQLPDEDLVVASILLEARKPFSSAL
jgi:SAM-dependent methyltransferase